MSEVKALRYLLRTNGALTAVVAADNIVPGVLPQGTALPAIGLTKVSAVRPQNVRAGNGLVRARIQATVMASTYPALEQIMPLLRAAASRSRGNVNGVNVDSIVVDAEGPDFNDERAAIYMRTQDFLVNVTE